MDQQNPIRIQRKKMPIGGIILVVVGATWLLQNLGFSWANGIWFPLVIIVIGLSLILKGHARS